MRQHSQRPVFINLFQIRFPVGALLSILHRVTGVVLVLSMPLLVYLLQLLNSGESGFAEASSILQSLTGKMVFSLVFWALIQHTLSGIRHLLMDLDFGYAKNVARNTARITFAISALLIIITGIAIWA